jgi:lysophospholipase L1-like esterase
MNRKQLLLLCSATLLSALLALAILRYFAPRLFGYAADTQFVQLSKEQPAFYENIFREEDLTSHNLLSQDPIVAVRGRPFFPEEPGMGPHDILGFRNQRVPKVADLLFIGDSQTYGNNVLASENWPRQLLRELANPQVVDYNISTGGWAAVQYLHLFRLAKAFRPKVIIVAFYSGNDSLESFKEAYRFERFKELRPDHSLTFADMPHWQFPPPREDAWQVQFKDGSKTIFTPKLRWYSNDPSSAPVRAGYQIMQNVARIIAREAGESKVALLFTIVPTKELVFLKRLQQERIELREDYRKLVEAENTHIRSLSAVMKESGAAYVDLLDALSEEALQTSLCYPPDQNGHPLYAGYRAIARALAPTVRPMLPQLPDGLYQQETTAAPGEARYYLLRSATLALFASNDLVVSNGWQLSQARAISDRELMSFTLMGAIRTSDVSRFGPPIAQ